MILYLSSTQHTNLLDFTGWYNADSELPIKKMVGSFICIYEYHGLCPWF